jgi:hypothetical protein
LIVDPEDFRRHYAALSDRALLSLRREDLVPIAQQCYDVELAQRGIAAHRKAAAAKRKAIPEEPDASVNDLRFDPGRTIPETPDWADTAVSVGKFRLDQVGELADATSVLDKGGIPSHLERRTVSTRQYLELMVPAGLGKQAEKLLQTEIADPTAEAVFERHFGELTDEELLGLNRDGLPEVARAAWEEELALRELEAPDTSPPGDFVPVAVFESASEAESAMNALRSAEVPCHLETQPAGEGDPALTQLMVPASLFYRASEILDVNMSGEDLGA